MYFLFRYIYGGRLSLEEYDTSDIIKILVAGSELGLQELINYLQSFLIETKSNWMELNFNLIYQTSYENNSFLELQKYCTDLVSEEPDKIFESSNFSSIPENLLISLIQNDNLQMNEIQIWERVIKWGLAQNPELPSDFTNYSKEDFKTLRNTLQHCIPFIRFYNLTSKEFTDKILPCRKLLPKELYEDLLRTFLNLLDSNSKPSNKSQPRIVIRKQTKQTSAKLQQEPAKRIQPSKQASLQQEHLLATNMTNKFIPFIPSVNKDDDLDLEPAKRVQPSKQTLSQQEHDEWMPVMFNKRVNKRVNKDDNLSRSRYDDM